VADVQLVHAVDRGNWFDVAIREPVTGVENEAGGADSLACG